MIERQLSEITAAEQTPPPPTDGAAPPEPDTSPAWLKSLVKE